MKLYVGTYTRPAPYLASTNGKGLYVLDFDPATGTLTLDAGGPRHREPLLPVHLAGRSQPARGVGGVRLAGGAGELVRHRARRPGALRYQGVQGARGTVSLLRDDGHAVARRARRQLLVGQRGHVPRPTGRLTRGGVQRRPAHRLRARTHARQEGPHAHCIVRLAGRPVRLQRGPGRGRDRRLPRRLRDEPLVRHTTLTMPAGSGPRHLAFAPGRPPRLRHLRAGFHDGGARLRPRHGHPVAPRSRADAARRLRRATATARTSAVHPSGRFVYGSNRGHDSITMFRVEADGRLALLGHRSTEGKTPRNFTLDTGRPVPAGREPGQRHGRDAAHRRADRASWATRSPWRRCRRRCACASPPEGRVGAERPHGSARTPDLPACAGSARRPRCNDARCPPSRVMPGTQRTLHGPLSPRAGPAACGCAPSKDGRRTPRTGCRHPRCCPRPPSSAPDPGRRRWRVQTLGWS